MHLDSAQLDRAIGAVLASAVGDALGAQYEFSSSIPDTQPVEYGAAPCGHAPGEWTDDTTMAVPIVAVLARGGSLQDPDDLARIADEWHQWGTNSPKDIGSQTRSVLHRLRRPITETAAREAAQAVHAAAGRSGGNGSLMRTGPVALGYLADGRELDLLDAVERVCRLTHWEQDNVDACALWSLAIRHAIRTGQLDLAGQVAFLAPDRRMRWAALIAESVAPGLHPRDVDEDNGWVVGAFKAAHAAIVGASSLMEALERAVRCGDDTDTVAAIAGSLAGAVWGSSAVPADYLVELHGWPGITGAQLARKAALAARGGVVDGKGWPRAERVEGYAASDFLAQLPADEGVWVGSILGLDRLEKDAPEVDAVVSLCQVGTAQIPRGMTSVQVRLIDQPGLERNPNLAVTLAGAADAIAKLRGQGRTVFLHCLEGRSRTSAVAALYAARHCGLPMAEAWAAAESALPAFAPQPFLRDAVEQIVSGTSATG